MNIEVGNNPLENVAVRLNDVKAGERHIAENQKPMNVAEDEVVLELSNTEQVKTEALDKVQGNVKEQSQEKTDYPAAEIARNKAADTQHILENINI